MADDNNETLVLASSCIYCKYNENITAVKFKDRDLTKCFVFKTCPLCPKCKRRLTFKSPKRRKIQDVWPIPAWDVDFIIKYHLRRGSDLRRNPPSNNFDSKCAVAKKMINGIPLDPSELSFIYGVKEWFEFHDNLQCKRCQELLRQRDLYFEETTGNVIKMIRDTYGIIERLYKYFMERELQIIPNGECIICLENINDVETCRRCFKCEKQYHKECIRRWIEKNKSCPHCRQSLESNVFIYFTKDCKFYSFFEGNNVNFRSVFNNSGMNVINAIESSEDEGDDMMIEDIFDVFENGGEAEMAQVADDA